MAHLVSTMVQIKSRVAQRKVLVKRRRNIPGFNSLDFNEQCTSCSPGRICLRNPTKRDSRMAPKRIFHKTFKNCADWNHSIDRNCNADLLQTETSALVLFLWKIRLVHDQRQNFANAAHNSTFVGQKIRVVIRNDSVRHDTVSQNHKPTRKSRRRKRRETFQYDEKPVDFDLRTPPHMRKDSAPPTPGWFYPHTFARFYFFFVSLETNKAASENNPTQQKKQTTVGTAGNTCPSFITTSHEKTEWMSITENSTDQAAIFCHKKSAWNTVCEKPAVDRGKGYFVFLLKTLWDCNYRQDQTISKKDKTTERNTSSHL